MDIDRAYPVDGQLGNNVLLLTRVLRSHGQPGNDLDDGVV